MFNNLIKMLGGGGKPSSILAKSPVRKSPPLMLATTAESKLSQIVSEELESTEFMRLDDYVKAGGGDDDGGQIFYARINGDSYGAVDSGDLAVVSVDRKPNASDLVLLKSGDRFSILKYSEVERLSRSALRLVASNGKTVNIIDEDRQGLKILGVITHIVKTLVNTEEAMDGND